MKPKSDKQDLVLPSPERIDKFMDYFIKYIILLQSDSTQDNNSKLSVQYLKTNNFTHYFAVFTQHHN